MERLRLRIEHAEPEPLDEPPPTGFVQIEKGAARAILLTPEEVDPDRTYPLFTVLHGAGRQDEMLVKASRDEPARRDAFFLVPRSIAPTWDLIAGTDPLDLEFLEYAWDLIDRRYPIAPAQKSLIGYSDGASYALSVGLSNPQHFAAIMVWAAGFVVLEPDTLGLPDPKPRVYLEYGTHDPLFGFEAIAIPMRDNLKRAGYDVTFSVDEGGKHWPSSSFQAEALDWYFAGAGSPG